MLQRLLLAIGIALLHGCCLPKHTEGQQDAVLTGPPLGDLVDAVQKGADSILTAAVWKSFDEEAEHWASTCRKTKKDAESACAAVLMLADRACNAAGKGLVGEEHCRRIYAGDRTVCFKATGQLKEWCDMVAPGALCEQETKSQVVACDAVKAVPKLALTSVKIVANVAESSTTEGTFTLFVVGANGKNSSKRSTKVEVNLQLRPGRAGYKVLNGSSWSPRKELAAQEKSKAGGEHGAAATIERTVLDALTATAAKFQTSVPAETSNGTDNRPQGDEKIVPLRPRTLVFAFDFSVTATGGGGLNIDLTPTPVKLTSGITTEGATSNQLVFEFGPEP